MSNPLHKLYIQAELPANSNSLLKILGDLQKRYEYICDLHEEGNRKYTKQKDLSSGRDVVLVHMTSDEEAEIEKFAEETEISLNLQHPGIVPHYDAGQDETGYFFTRKWMDEQSLRQRINSKIRIWNKDQAYRIFLQLCEAISYAHSQKIYHGNLKPEKVFITESGIVSVNDWAKAANNDKTKKHKDLLALGNMLLSIMNLCLDFETVPAGLKAIARKACNPNRGYKSVRQLMSDFQSFRDGYVPKAESLFLVKSVFQFIKRNPLFCLVITTSLGVIIVLSIWFFDNLKERQEVIDTNLKEAEIKKTEADNALKEFIKENELRKEIALEAAEAHAAEARTALRLGDMDKAREMGAIAWHLNNKEKFTREAWAHLAFIDQNYEVAEQIYSDKEIRYFDKILNLTRKYKQKKPDINELLQDFEYTDRKELTFYAVNRLLFQKSGTDFKEKFIEIIKFFNPEAKVELKTVYIDGNLTLDLSGSRNIKTLDFLIGMPIITLDIRNTGITDVDLRNIPQLKKVLHNKGQTFKTGKRVERISR